jgi:phosphate transport system substrate-binding protein
MTISLRVYILFIISFLGTNLLAQTSRDYISIVGSSTVYPFSIVVAENFGLNSNFRTPTIESTGSGGGIRAFCQGIGLNFPDVTNSSRRIRSSEISQCASNGVEDLIEVKIGYDGIVIANAIGSFEYNLTRQELFLALAKTVVGPNDQLIDNPYQLWSDINPSLPAVQIEVLGPPPTSGTRDAFIELVMDVGCASFPAIIQLQGDDRQIACQSMREDGLFIEAGENDNMIVQRLGVNDSALGIFGYSFLVQNLDRVQGASIDGVSPEFDNISNGSYPISRPLYFYLKSAHVGIIPGLNEFLIEFTDENAIGEFGYLTDRGLIPMSEEEFMQIRTAARQLSPLQL